MLIWAIAATVIAIICGIHWLVRYLGCAALLLYIETKWHCLPTKEEIDEYAEQAIYKTFGHKDVTE